MVNEAASLLPPQPILPTTAAAATRSTMMPKAMQNISKHFPLLAAGLKGAQQEYLSLDGHAGLRACVMILREGPS